MNEAIERAARHIMEVLADEDNVHFSEFYDGTKETEDRLSELLGLQPDGEPPDCVMHYAIDRLIRRGLVETYWRDPFLRGGTNDYTISLTDRGRRRLGKRLKYLRIEHMAAEIVYRNCNVFRKPEMIVSDMRSREIDPRRKKSRQYAVLVLRKFLSLGADYSAWIYCPQCPRRIWTGPDRLSEHAPRYVDLFLDECDCGRIAVPFCACREHGGLLSFEECTRPES